MKYLCGKINKEEWSGVLFYSVEGSIRDPANMVLTAEDVFLMDKGSTGYTNYSFNDPKLAEYVMSDNYNINWKIGHIHSHHSMRVFFSGTDTDEIHDNSEFHNYYLSLIVNNFMDREAKIAFRGSVAETVVSYQARDEDGEFYPLSTRLVAKDKVFVINCDIEVADTSITVPDSFIGRVEEIINKKDEKEAAYMKEKYFGKDDDKRPYQTGSYSQGFSGGRFMDGWDAWAKGQIKEQTKAPEEEDPTVEDFLAYVLRMGSKPIHVQNLDPLQNMDAALCDLLDKKVDMKVLVKHINEKLPDYYRRFYGVAIATHPRFYEDILKDCMDILEQYVNEEYKYKPLFVVFRKHHSAIAKKISETATNGTANRTR